MPSSWRSRRRVRLELREGAEHVEEALAAAVAVSIGCSVAFNDAPRAFTVRTMSCRSAMLRARRTREPVPANCAAPFKKPAVLA